MSEDRWRFFRACTDGNLPPGRREFYGVADDVDHHSHHFGRVAAGKKFPRRQIHVDSDVFGVGLYPQRLRRVINYHPDWDYGFRQHQTFVFDLPQVENVIDGGEHPVAIGLQTLQVADSFFRHWPDHAAQHVGYGVNH